MKTTELGDAGSNRISAYLSIAAHANIRHGSYSEDSQKCDFLFTFNNAFDSSELCELAGQAKTGKSFYKIDPLQKTVRIDNISDVKTIIRKSGIPIIIFVDSLEKDIYWYAPDLRSKRVDTVKIPENQIIVPSIWIDFSRMYRYWQYQSNRYLTQTMTNRTLDKKLIKSNKKSFKELLANNIVNPIAGEIRVTNKAWEHVTRISRTKIARQMSIRSAPHLGHFLSKNPDRIDQKNMERKEMNGSIHETREIILYYRNGIYYNNSKFTFAVRLDELIIYPKNWFEQALKISDIIHESSLKRFI